MNRYLQKWTKGVIVYYGYQSDIRSFYAKTHCTIHPSFIEGMSNVLLESCATGRPIITTDRSGCGEIVEEGINGYIVKQQDAKDLIKQIEKFVTLTYEEKKQMGESARKKVEQEFDRQIVINAYLDAVQILRKTRSDNLKISQ